ncbi:hypothetical protein [Sphingomonas hankyongi]|uniref:Uncharacterized protein n=1 Tax=Sphingomonas hankyongi TaxID=2908209 RepID=A0ABT0S4C7_9SPHN|nr:hypothetical protein [Sphingomonas hankyongi]MCL6730702.1 hypothetical protein [Sphingomonas hankyongi]
MSAFLIGIMLAQVATPADIPKKPLYTATGEKVRCELVTELHSRIPSRICRTEGQWAEIERQNDKALRDSSKNTSSEGFNNGFAGTLSPPH